MTEDPLQDWERLLAAERHLQALVPGTVLVGGTAAALHAEHRVSLDGDHVLPDLAKRFDEVLADLEAAAGWETSRVRRPVLILGNLEGVLTGIRQLRRVRALETEEISGLRVPTLAEMARIKSWLLATRFTVRDYLDTVVLYERLEEAGVRKALQELDDIYPQESGTSVLAEVVERLSSARPVDLAEINLESYRGLGPPWNNWQYVTAYGRGWASVLVNLLLSPRGESRFDLSKSRALWNRNRLTLESDEVLAQILDRGELEAWREIYRLASGPGEEAATLRRRILRLCETVPLSLPHLFIAAMSALGEPMERYPSVPPPRDDIA